MPAYNSLKYLGFTLGSLEKQDIGFEIFEVIVVDDGSNDGTEDYLKNYSGQINLRPVINQKNLGRARSRNAGIQNSSNELIIFLDSDIEVEPDFIRLHLEQNKNLDVACVGKVIFHKDIKKTKFMKYLDSRGAAKIYNNVQVPGQYFRTTNSSVPKKILMKIGCFDENFTSYGGEDTEIGMRISREIKIISLPGAIGYNRHIRNLEDTLKIIKEYGEYSLPHLLKKEPELADDLKIKKGAADFFYGLMCQLPFYMLIKFLAERNLTPMFAYSYLLLRNYRTGYKDHLKKLHMAGK
jgi:glycosyltransferase involved in cell wall biosynthesis